MIILRFRGRHVSMPFLMACYSLLCLALTVIIILAILNMGKEASGIWEYIAVVSMGFFSLPAFLLSLGFAAVAKSDWDELKGKS